MKLHVQVVHGAIGFVDRSIDCALVVEPPRVQPPATSVEKVQHRPDSVPEGFGLFDREARAVHANTISTHSRRQTSSVEVSELFAQRLIEHRRQPHARLTK